MKNKIEYKGVQYTVEDNRLVHMYILNDMLVGNKRNVDIVIPHIFPTGEEITIIDQRLILTGAGNLSDKEVNVFIFDGIVTIEPNAFEFATIHTVRWPSTCPVIPDKCFKCSYIVKICNISHVESVGEGAFLDSNIRKIRWPSKCERIPECCFCGSRLEKIYGIEGVKQIEERAFEATNINKFEWPEQCSTIPARCFKNSKLLSILGIEEVEEVSASAFANTLLQTLKWPSKCTDIPSKCFSGSEIRTISNLQNIQHIGERCFECADNLEIDLSEAAIISIELNAFAGLKREKVKLPFYFTDEEV